MLYSSVFILFFILVLCNLSLTLTIEGTADAKQGSLSLQGQYLFFHFHKTFSQSWLQLQAFHQPLLLPAVHHWHNLSPGSAKKQLTPIVQAFLRGLHLHKLNLHCDLALTIYPYMAIVYGLFCGVFGALRIRQNHPLPLQFEIGPSEQGSFLYAKSIISLTPAHIIIICLRLLKYFLQNGIQQLLKSKGRHPAYHERASY